MPRTEGKHQHLHGLEVGGEGFHTSGQETLEIPSFSLEAGLLDDQEQGVPVGELCVSPH